MKYWCVLSVAFLRVLHSSNHYTTALNATDSSMASSTASNVIDSCDFYQIKRTREYHNNSVTILVQNKAPFSFYDQSKDDFQGVEISFIRTISERLRLKPFFTMDQQDDNSKCNRRYADILIGGLERYKQYGKEFQPSKPHFRDDIVWCLQAPRNIPKWMNFYIILRDWAFPTLAVMAYFCGNGLLYCLNRNYGRYLTIHHCHMIVFQLMLNISNHYKPEGLMLKTLYIIIFACCLVLNVTVVAYYTTFQIVPALWMQSKDTNGLIMYGRQLTGSYDTLQTLRLQNKFPDGFLNNFRVCDAIDECLDELLLTDKMAVGVSRHHVMNYPSVPFADLTCFDEYPSIYSYFISVFVQDNFQQRDEVFQLAQRAFESGLFVKWLCDVQVHQKQFVPYPLEPFQIAHMGAALAGALGVLMLGVGAFMLEMMAFKEVQKPNPAIFWILTEMFVNNERYFFNGRLE